MAYILIGPKGGTIMRGKEITRAVKLCDDRGNLNLDSIGWSRHPMILCNVKGSFLRKKEVEPLGSDRT